MNRSEQILPPDLGIAEFEALAAKVVRVAARWLVAEADDPLLESISGLDLAALMDEPPPESGSDVDVVLQEVQDKLMRYSRRNGHPRYFAHVCASPDPVGALADLLASVMNQNITAWRSAPAAVTVERLLLRWLDTLVGFEGGGHGTLLGGGSAANMHALGAAVQHTLDAHPDARRADLVLYMSQETHLSLVKAARFIGIEHVRRLPVDGKRRLAPQTLRQAMHDDLRHGRRPAMVAASAGTANAGTVDPLQDLAAECRAAGIWFHIDGAYGAPAAMTEAGAWMREGFRQADSLSLDPHKWLFAPLDTGVLLVRDAERLRAAYAETSEYVTVTQTAPLEDFACWDYSMELSRRFRALKLWFMFKLRGVDVYRQAIARNIALRAYLDERIEDATELELLASGLSISCFRYRRPGMDEETLNHVNAQIQQQLMDSGRIILSPTVLDGRYSLRICMVNFRTRREDMDWLLEQIAAFGRAIA